MHLSDALERYGDMKYSSAAATMGGLDEKGRGVGREVQEEMSKVTRTFTGVRAGATSYERRGAYVLGGTLLRFAPPRACVTPSDPEPAFSSSQFVVRPCHRTAPSEKWHN